MTRRNRAMDIQAAQQKAVEFTRLWLTANALGLPGDMPEEDFAHTMNVITRGLVQAFVKGYTEDR